MVCLNQRRWASTARRTGWSGSAYSAAALMNGQPRNPGLQLSAPIASAMIRNASGTSSAACRTWAIASRSHCARRSR